MSRISIYVKSNLNDIIKAMIIILLSFLLSIYLKYNTNNINHIIIIYILTVTCISRFTVGYFWGIFYSVIGLFSFRNSLVTPNYILGTSQYDFLILFLTMLIISITISNLTTYIKKQDKLTAEREEVKKKLNKINNKLLSSNGISYIIDLTLDYVSELTKSTVVFYTQSPQLGHTGVVKSISKEHEKIMNSSHEQFIAHWVFENMVPAGVDTDFCGDSSYTYFPLISHGHVWGVLGIYTIDRKSFVTDNFESLDLIISQVAMALERQHLTDNQQQIIVDTEKEKMRANLLRAVSHDLRTPLTGMIGASETLLKSKNSINIEEQTKLIEYIYEDSNWLLHMVENLLTVTRISGDNSSVKKSLEPLEEVVSESITRIQTRYPNASIKVKIPDEFLMIPMDATLIEQVIINLIENAIKYSNSDKPVELLVTKSSKEILFHIVDYGIGIPSDSIDKIFDGLSHSDNQSSDTKKGLGIGLSICKTIINAHGGTLTAKSNEGSGAVFVFSLPIKES